MPRAPRTEYTDERLEGKAMEEAFERAAAGAPPPAPPSTIRMQRADGVWEDVGPGGDREDGRALSIIEHMDARVRPRVVACLGTLGWSVVSAVFFFTDADGNLQNLDLLLRAGPAAGALDGREALVELTWSQGTPAKASQAGSQKLQKYWSAQARVPRRRRLVGTLGVVESRFHLTLAEARGAEPAYFRNVRHLHKSGPHKSGAEKRARGIGVEAEKNWRAANADKCQGYHRKVGTRRRADRHAQKKAGKTPNKKGKTRKQVKKRKERPRR